jgi:flagellar assembly protein FliH
MGRIVKAEKPVAPGAPAPAAVTEVAALLAAARAEANQERARAKEVAIVLARKMAEKIVGHAVDLDPAVMAEMAAQALRAAKPGREAVLLRVHPEDLASLQAERGPWLGESGLAAGVRVVPDVSVGRYGCVVETAVGRLDARLETQLDALEAALRSSGLRRA